MSPGSPGWPRDSDDFYNRGTNTMKPCPFCGGTNITRQVNENLNRVTCHTCDIVKIPAESWNQRPADRAALIAVARLVANEAKGYGSEEWGNAQAERLVDKYLAEQAIPDAPE